jgi:Phage holin T7 family, holin superfamily II
MINNLDNSQQHLENGLTMAAAKVSPPVIVSGLTVAGVQLQDWLIMATLLYTVIQIIIALPKLKQSFKEWRKK